MNFKLILLFILGFFIFNSLTYSNIPKRTVDEEVDELADTSRKNNTDSLKAARAAAADSAHEARQRISDSTKNARQAKTDSVQAVRKHITDSTSAMRKYRDSKHYKDSVTRSRNQKVKSLKTSRQSHMDSVKDARKQITDSLASARKGRTDSLKTMQKHRTDSLARIKKYRSSKRYADSVSVVRHERLDSMKDAQKSYRDSIASVRKHSLDSAKTSRKHVMDSTKLVRTKYTDSLKVVRKARTDSLAKIKANKEKLAKAKEKKKEDQLKLKLELKMKQKHEAWSNKTMLKKRWSPVRRVLQNSFTHYNYYYNSNKKMDEALLNMQRTRKENYDSLIGLYPFDPNRDSSRMSADMDSIVHKISVGIQIHDPRVKWSNDLYLLLGQAYYYKGRYENASIAFRYIISTDEEAKKKTAGYTGNSRSKEAPSILEEEKTSRLDFLKHKSVHNEAILWLSRTYAESHHVENAESVLSLLESDAKLPEHLRGRLAIEKAFAFLIENNQLEASNQLAIAVDDNNLPNWLRLRAAFLNGQLLQNLGQYTEAANSFEKVLGYYPKIDMDFYARKYIAYNRLQAGEDLADATIPLKKILNDGKYLNYYDQVYYVLGKISAKANKNDDAIKYLTRSTSTPKATKKQKALSFAALGDVYYATSDYDGAKNAYDSASKYSSAAGKDEAVAAAVQRSKGLKEISVPAAVIHEQDSLMELASRSRKEQLSVVRRYLRDLEQKQQDSIQNAENSGVAAVAQAEAENEGAESNWYFGNPAIMQQGSADFKKKWGNRPLTDNWRRAAGNSLANSASSQGDDDALAVSPADNGLPSEESLLSRIPNSPQQKELATKITQRAYMLLAKAYVKQLEDYNRAIHTMDTLDIRFPNHNQKEDELYLRYQIALKQNKLDQAQAYSQELLNKFPQSQYANMLRPKQSESRPTMENTTGKTVSAYYDETYALVMQHQYTEALMRINVAKQQFDNPVYKKRFEVAEAMAYAGSGDYDRADSVISRFLKNNQGDTLANWASTVKEYIAEVRNGGKPAWYKDWPPKEGIAAAKTAKEAEAATPKAPPPPPVPEVPAMYSYRAGDSDYNCIVVLPGIDSKTAGLKKSVRNFDSGKYASAGLEILMDMYSMDQGVLVVKKFHNQDQAKNYMNDLLASDVFTGYAPGDVHTFIITQNNYKKMFADKDVLPYVSFYAAYYSR